MSLSWPWALLSVLVIPLIFAVRWWALRRRRRAAVRVTSLALVRTALPGRTRWTRKIPPALLVAGLVLLVIGAARPQASVPVPQTSATILLALDTSGSMCSTDVDPNRLTAARKAAAEFIESQRGGPRIGLVTFAGTAGLLVPPTDDTDALIEALEGLAVARGTAIGQAMLTSIDAIAEVDPSVAPTGADPGSGGEGYAGAAVVVLTDGANTQGVDPQTAAQEAALRRVRVFTIGFGTTNPAPMVCANSQFDGRGFGSWGGRGRGGFDRGSRNPRTIDEPALKQIAETTGGSYHRAENADQLQTALDSLPGTFTVIRQKVDTAAVFAGGGALLVIAALSLSLWWNRPRTPSR
ncbi:VWA domain-containing protein [Nonomuraea sp. NPDC048826]|uniref:VWA domain-containing protein n=1 Tax=Nonomuraea sp. NPDC048826 TaxID=3364347 RepID=UPI0037207053